MTVKNATEAAENWDDDFLFQQGPSSSSHAKQRVPDAVNARCSTSSSADWGSDAPSRHAKPTPPGNTSTAGNTSTVTAAQLQEWADPGPSTPPKRSVVSVVQAENWDDDFEDKVDSPASPSRRRARRGEYTRQQQAASLPQVQQEPENWDDDFELDKANSPPRGEVWSSDDEDDGPAFGEEEDRTVTARSRRTAVPKPSPPPPVPPLPTSFPGSPSLSVFSIPSGRDSVAYSSAAHLPLRAGSNSALAMLPPSPPIHKERRRLRKKSRPPENNVFELLDRNRDERSPPPVPPPQDSPPHPASPNQSMSSKTPLLSRIGSVKKWGARKKRASTGPAEVLLNELDGNKDATPRPASRISDAQHQSQTGSPSSKHSSWFFRNSGSGGGAASSGSSPNAAVAELRHEKSLDRFRAPAALDSPTRIGKKRASVMNFRPQSGNSSGSTPDGTPPPSPVPRRPKSMQVPPGRSIFPRHASHGAMTVGRAAARTEFGTSTEDFRREVAEAQEQEKEKEGQRGFMGGMRRISLAGGKKHKRTKSAVAQEREKLPEAPDASALMPELAHADSANREEDLLPPIELQPPSPARGQGGPGHSSSELESLPAIESLLLRPSAEVEPQSTSGALNMPRASPVKAPGSPQSASLGRNTQPPPPPSTSSSVLRRNSLGDLKIPARISQAQVGLKRDLSMVRDFAASVDKLKELQNTYHTLVQEVQVLIMETSRPPSRATSPTFFSIPRPRSRARSNTNPVAAQDVSKRFATAFYTIDSKYKISWECAELLIELGGGNASATSPPGSTTSAPVPDAGLDMSSRKSRERAVTLAGDESKPPPLPMAYVGPPLASPPSLGWRASTGRNDLSQRQLWLLRDMLNNAESTAAMADLQIPEEGPVNRNWGWGNAMSSTITLPSDESAQNTSPSKKRRSSRRGMSGLRDMLRSLTRQMGPQHRPPSQTPSASASAESSQDGHGGLPIPAPQSQSQRRQSKASTGPDSVSSARGVSPFGTSSSFTHRSSPRRPSIASIFRFAQKSKASVHGSDVSGEHAKGGSHPSSSGSDLGGRNTPDEEDWDRVESAEDLDAAAKALGVSRDGLATIRGRKTRSPYLNCKPDPATPRKNTAAHSQSSLSASGDSPVHPHPQMPQILLVTRPTRLSNVEEAAEQEPRGGKGKGKGKRSGSKSRSGAPSASPHRPMSRGGGGKRPALTGSVRSAPPPPLEDPKLAMTPENIQPLLENAREVHARCSECIGELRLLLAAKVQSETR